MTHAVDKVAQFFQVAGTIYRKFISNNNEQQVHTHIIRQKVHLVIFLF